MGEAVLALGAQVNGSCLRLDHWEWVGGGEGVGLEGGSSLIRLSSRYFGSRLSSVREGEGGLRKSFFLELLELLLPSSEMSFMNVLKSMLSFSASSSLKARTSSPRLLSKSPFLSSFSRNFNMSLAAVACWTFTCIGWSRTSSSCISLKSFAFSSGFEGCCCWCWLNEKYWPLFNTNLSLQPCSITELALRIRLEGRERNPTFGSLGTGLTVLTVLTCCCSPTFTRSKVSCVTSFSNSSITFCWLGNWWTSCCWLLDSQMSSKGSTLLL